jgi:hypothetical protein
MKTMIKNRIREVISQKEVKGFRFKPSNDFYRKIGIGRRRWGLLLRNEQPFTLDELKKIADFFDIELQLLYEHPVSSVKHTTI